MKTDPNQRVGDEASAPHQKNGSTKAPSTATAPTYATPRSKAPARRQPSTIRESPAFDEASEAVDRATFKPKATPKTVPRKKVPSKLALSQLLAEDETPPAKKAAPSKVQTPTPTPKTNPPVQRTIPRVADMLPPPTKPASAVKKSLPPRSKSTVGSGFSTASRFLSWTEKVKETFWHCWAWVMEWLYFLLAVVGLLLILFLVIFGTDNAVSRNAEYQYQTTINTIRHYIPDAVAHPLYLLNDKSIRSLDHRVTELEISVNQLKLDVKRDHEAIERVSNQLPNFVVAKKDKKGEIQLPIDFWHAIKGKITSDKDFQTFSKKGAEKSPAVSWDDFFKSNEQRIKKIATDEVKVSRSEIEEMIQQEIEGAKTHSAKDIAELRKHVTDHYSHKSETVHLDDVRKYIDQDVSRQLSSSKIEALISNKIREQSKQRMRAYNHFAETMGAIILPQHTSPTYLPDHYEGVGLGGWAVGKIIAASGTRIREPLEAEAALKQWNDAGDCWCAATKKENGAQLHVRTKEEFYPTEVIIEHVNLEATLDKGSAPKDMELFVKIPVKDQDEVALASRGMFPDAADEKVLDHEWVRVARWTYDFTLGQDVQVFGVQLDLKRWGVKTRDFVVRAKNNWGGDCDHTCFYRVRVHGTMPEQDKKEEV